MEWTKYTIHTTEAAEDLIGYMLSEMGIIGVEIADKVPVTAAENGGYFGDVVPEMPENDHLAEISFYLKKSPKGALANAAAGGEELSATAAEDFHLPKAPIISEDFDPGTGPIRRDGESESDRREREILQADPEEVLARVRAGLAEIAEYCDIGEGTITESVTGEEDWVNNWKQYFHSFTVSGVRIVPSWEEEGLASKGGATPEGSVAGDDVVPESGAAGAGVASGRKVVWQWIMWFRKAVRQVLAWLRKAVRQVLARLRKVVWQWIMWFRKAVRQVLAWLRETVRQRRMLIRNIIGTWFSGLIRGRRLGRERTSRRGWRLRDFGNI